MQRRIILFLSVIVIVGAIYILQSNRAGNGGVFDIVELTAPSTGMDIEQKEKMFEKAKEITTPDGFLNIDNIKLADHIGKDVILIDFWTYSCINCQRTFPYLNAWWEKYKDEGLVMIGIHTPEFEFEKKLANVADAVQRFNIKFPVVLDNDYSTWKAYQNRYWPHKYLIDIDGFIVYDHIGEGAYDVTEKQIQKLLKERNERLGISEKVSTSISEIDAETKGFVRTPEIYFGASRNGSLANGVPYLSGIQQLVIPKDLDENGLYLEGDWEITPEFAINKSANAKIVLTYEAKNVFAVASAENEIEIIILRDASPLTMEAGSDVFFENAENKVIIQEDRLYRLIEDPKGSAKHVLEITITKPGLKIFTFTFG